MRLIVEVIMCIAMFGLGHWTALHPNETRTFWERIQAAAGRLIHRNP